MADPFVISHLRPLPLFAALPDVQLEQVAGVFEIQRYEPGELIFQQGTPVQGMYVFVNGRATLLQSTPEGEWRPLGGLAAGKSIHENALFAPDTERAALRVDERVVLLFAPRERFQSLLAAHPEIRANLRLRQSDQQARSAGRVFSAQLENEQVLLTTRRSPWAFVRRLWLPLLIAFALGAFALMAGSSGISVVLLLLALVVPGGIALYELLEWRNDRVIITNQRIIREERNILRLNSHVSEVPLQNVQEVNAEYPRSDPFARLFNYGTVEIRTAGSAGNYVLDLLPDPDHVQDIIFNHRERMLQDNVQRQRSTIRADLDRALGGSGGQTGSGTPPAAPPAVPAKRGGLLDWMIPQVRFINEKGELVYRKHWLVWAVHVMIPLTLLVAGFGFTVIPPLILPAVNATSLGLAAAAFGVLMMLISIPWFIFEHWDWRNDLYIIGDDTITLIHRRPLWLQNENDQILLRNVANVVAEKTGLFSTLLNYGNVRISLVGGDLGAEKVFEGVESPETVQAEIGRRQALLRGRQQQEADQRQREMFGEYLSAYHERYVGGQAAQPGADAYSAAAAPPAQPSDVLRPPQPLQERVRPQYAPRSQPDNNRRR